MTAAAGFVGFKHISTPVDLELPPPRSCCRGAVEQDISFGRGTDVRLRHGRRIDLSPPSPGLHPDQGSPNCRDISIGSPGVCDRMFVAMSPQDKPRAASLSDNGDVPKLASRTCQSVPFCATVRVSTFALRKHGLSRGERRLYRTSPSDEPRGMQADTCTAPSYNHIVPRWKETTKGKNRIQPHVILVEVCNHAKIERTNPTGHAKIERTNPTATRKIANEPKPPTHAKIERTNPTSTRKIERTNPTGHTKIERTNPTARMTARVALRIIRIHLSLPPLEQVNHDR